MNAKIKLRIIFIESILSAAGVGFCIPIMTLFWNSVGMDQTLIGISQMMFTVAILFCDIPMGYIADKYSRKTLNIIGGFGMGLACIVYALSRNFWVVVLAEILQGVFMGMTNGVDRAFLKFYSDKNITHPIIWVFTPLLIAIGVPAYLVGLGWIFNYLFSTLGTFLARKTIRFKPSVRFLIPMMAAAFGMLPIIINVNMITVWVFALTGLAQGFPEVTLTSAIQQKTEDKYQTTVVSIATTMNRLIYIPLVSITNWAGSLKPEYTMVTALVILLPLAAVVFFRLRKYENQKIPD